MKGRASTWTENSEYYQEGSQYNHVKLPLYPIHSPILSSQSTFKNTSFKRLCHHEVLGFYVKKAKLSLLLIKEYKQESKLSNLWEVLFKSRKKKKSSFCLTFSRNWNLNSYFLGYFWCLIAATQSITELKKKMRKRVWWYNLYMEKQINNVSKYQLWSGNLRGKKSWKHSFSQ